MTRRRRYSAEFKREALRRANEEGVTDVLVAEELGIDAMRVTIFQDLASGVTTALMRPLLQNLLVPAFCVHNHLWRR